MGNKPEQASDMDVEIGQRLRAHREASGMSQAVLAERMAIAGVAASQTMVAKWERAYTPMRFREAIAACHAIGVPVTALSGDVVVDQDQALAALQLAQTEIQRTMDALIQSRKI